MTRIHADIGALRELHHALARFRHAQRDLVNQGDDRIAVTRASLEATAGRWQARLEQGRAELDACQGQASQAPAGEDLPVDCSGYARAVSEAEEKLERIRLWQYRIDQEASEFRAIAIGFRNLLENDLPRTEGHLLGLIASLEGARRVQAPGP